MTTISDVLILDGQSRKSLPVVQSLGQRGLNVVVGEKTRICLSRFSKYCRRTVVYPSPKIYPEAFVDFLINEVRKNNYDCIFAMMDETVRLVIEHQVELAKYTAVPFPSLETFNKAANKQNTLQMAMQFGIPCPQTFFINDIEEVRKLQKELTFPVVLKPQESYGSRGIRYVTKEYFVMEYERLHRIHNYPMIQEYIPPGGNAYGVSALFDATAKPIAVCVHRRLREYPVTGGPSTLRESVWEPYIANMGITLLKALNWYGVAMVEFKVDPRDGIPKLMEVNPRFWGSLPLAILAGVDFPFLLYKVATGGDVKPVDAYKVGVKCRWLLPGDILLFLSQLKRGKLEFDFFRFFEKSTGYDILSLQDPMPTIGLFLVLFRNVFDVNMWHYVFKR